MDDTYVTTTSVDSTSAAGLSGGIMFLYLAVVVYLIVTIWRIFEKAGQPGWAALIPIYNTYVLLKVVNRPWWWLLLMLIPLVNIVIWIIVALDLAKVFGKSTVFGVVGLILFTPVGYGILAFGSAKYLGGGNSAGGQAPTQTPTAPPAPAV